MTEGGLLVADNGHDGRGTIHNPTLSGGAMTGNDALPEEKIDRDHLLAISTDLIKSLHRRIHGRRFRSNQHDNAKLGYARALVQALQCHSAIIRDQEQEEIKDRLARIEAVMERRERERKYLEKAERESAGRRRP